MVVVYGRCPACVVCAFSVVPSEEVVLPDVRTIYRLTASAGLSFGGSGILCARPGERPPLEGPQGKPTYVGLVRPLDGGISARGLLKYWRWSALILQVVCYICNREFGRASIEIHQKA